MKTYYLLIIYNDGGIVEKKLKGIDPEDAIKKHIASDNFLYYDQGTAFLYTSKKHKTCVLTADDLCDLEFIVEEH